jgi:hypothetical protein
MQIRKLMEARIDLLPESFRAVFMLLAVEELSVTERAEALRLPERHRAQQILPCPQPAARGLGKRDGCHARFRHRWRALRPHRVRRAGQGTGGGDLPAE